MTKEERELAITYLEEMKESYIAGFGYERHPLPEYYAIENAIKALEQTRWIPVTERLPEEKEWYGTKKFGTTKSDEVYVTLRSPDGKYITDHTHFYNGKPSVTMVHLGFVPIAWMPLPEPFKAESEG